MPKKLPWAIKVSKQPYASAHMVKPTKAPYIKNYLGVNYLATEPDKGVLCIHFFWFHFYIGDV